MKKIIVVDMAPFGVISYISAKKWEIESIDEVVAKLKTLGLEPKDFNRSFVDIIGDALKEFGGTEFTDDIIGERPGGMSQEDWDKARNKEWYNWGDIIFCGGTGNPFVSIDDKKTVENVFIGQVQGNCVDKFITYKVNRFFANWQKCGRMLSENAEFRKTATDYHNSAAFEEDFASLSQMKDAAKKLYDDIVKFQEDITHGYE